jgi:hypothetical protein
MVASINTAGVISEYNNKEGTTNSDSRAPCVEPKAVFGEGVYTRGGLFMPR